MIPWSIVTFWTCLLLMPASWLYNHSMKNILVWTLQLTSSHLCQSSAARTGCTLRSSLVFDPSLAPIRYCEGRWVTEEDFEWLRGCHGGSCRFRQSNPGLGQCQQLELFVRQREYISAWRHIGWFRYQKKHLSEVWGFQWNSCRTPMVQKEGRQHRALLEIQKGTNIERFSWWISEIFSKYNTSMFKNDMNVLCDCVTILKYQCYIIRALIVNKDEFYLAFYHQMPW